MSDDLIKEIERLSAELDWSVECIDEASARIKELEAALRWLVNDMKEYRASQRPVFALEAARITLAGEKDE